MMVPFGLDPRLRARAWMERHLTHPVSRVLVAWHVSPNSLTMIGVVMAVAGAYLLSEGKPALGGAAMLAGAALDMFDGAVARLAGRASRFGAFLDSVMDRLGEAIVLFGLAVHLIREAHEFGLYLIFATLIVTLLVSYLRARAEGLGLSCDVGPMGRPERVVVLGTGLVLGYPLWALGVILVASAVTVAQRFVHVARLLRDR